LKAIYNNNPTIVQYFKDAAAAVSTGIVAKDIIAVLGYSNPQPADVIRVTAEIASLVDPTGISGVVAAYSYPLCSTITV
jgi:hypothetical protein